MIISVASGKGGTGKTTIATSLALAMDNSLLLDCDVEEPNCHIFIKPKKVKSEKVSVLVPVIDKTKCTYCGKCSEICEFNALVVAREKVLVFPNLCHSCGGCVLLCPHKAISEEKRIIGELKISDKLISGVLNVGEAIPVPMVSAVKMKIDKSKTIIIDASPGTSCVMVEAVKGSDYCILVTESSPFGLSDLKLAVEVVKKLGIPFGLVINKYNPEFKALEDYCKDEKINIHLKIPEDRKIAEGYSKGIPLVDIYPEYKKTLKGIMQ